MLSLFVFFLFGYHSGTKKLFPLKNDSEKNCKYFDQGFDTK